MNLHEYQAKQLLSDYGISIPAGRVARSGAEAIAVAKELGGGGWVVKAQVHAGGRGKAGGVKVARSLAEVEAFTNGMLGQRLVTKQTDRHGLPINSVLIEVLSPPARELYLGAVVDRSKRRVVIMASEAGGMDIEEVAEKTPHKILTAIVDPVAGLMPYQARNIGFALGLAAEQINPLLTIMQGLARLFNDKDASLLEINPLAVMSDGQLVAMDAKINIDDNALYRQAAIAAWKDATQENDKENQAQQYGLNYISLDGNIGCMVNGAGLAMATMDLIALHGGQPANFLDVGGGTTAEKVAEAFKLIVSDSKVQAVLVNIFGGIVRCDLIAEGIIKAITDVHVSIPVVVRLEGTNVERGRELLRECGLAIIPADSLTDAAQKVVNAARGKV